MDNETKCGFVAVIGAPNAGKSTITNKLVGQKVSIVSQKIQTTRFPVRGIAIHGKSQLIFVDTPGVFLPKERLDRAMVASVWSSTKDADLIIHMIDAPSLIRAKAPNPKNGDVKNLEDIERVHEGLKDTKRPVLLVLNKIDELEKELLLGLSQELYATGIYKEVFMVSALKSLGLTALLKASSDLLPNGVWLYPEDQVADTSSRLLASEITREKVFLRLHEELPYSSSVETENWTDNKDGSVRIDQTLFVSRESHKAIAIGKGGETLKWISTEARKEMMETFDRKVHLFVHVKVKENWANDTHHYKDRGLDFNA